MKPAIQGILYVIFSVLSSFTGVFLTKRWIENKITWYIILAFIFFFMGSVWYVRAMQFERIAIVEALWSVIMIVFTVVLGALVFHEKITVQEGAGIVLAIVAGVLLTVKI